MCITDENSIFIKLTILLAGISALFSLAVIIIHLKIPNLRKNPNFRYTIYIISSVFINNLFSAIYLKIWGMNVTCSVPMRIIGSIAFFGLYSSIIWCILFAWNIYQIIVKNVMDFTKNELYHIFFTLGISLIFTVVTTNLAISDGNCVPIFLSTDIQVNIAYIIPEFGIIMIVIVLYVKIIIASKTTLGGINYETFVKQIILYPIVVVIMITCVIAQQLIYQYDVCQFNAFHGLGFSKQLLGIMNAILYGYNSTVKEEIKYYYHNHSKPLLIQEITLVDSRN